MMEKSTNSHVRRRRDVCRGSERGPKKAVTAVSQNESKAESDVVLVGVVILAGRRACEWCCLCPIRIEPVLFVPRQVVRETLLSHRIHHQQPPHTTATSCNNTFDTPKLAPKHPQITHTTHPRPFASAQIPTWPNNRSLPSSSSWSVTAVPER